MIVGPGNHWTDCQCHRSQHPELAVAIIRDKRPQSIAELAELAGRAQPNLTRTLCKLVASSVEACQTSQVPGCYRFRWRVKLVKERGYPSHRPLGARPAGTGLRWRGSGTEMSRSAGSVVTSPTPLKRCGFHVPGTPEPRRAGIWHRRRARCCAMPPGR
jgi:hypothetical protein